MAAQNNNPFVMPGLGQGGDAGQNPLLASMEMMRQAWQSLGGGANLGPAAMLAPTSIEELDRRVADLRAVENWLRMNLSMLSSTIQGLEVQRATVATLKSFMATAGKQASADQPWWSPSASDAKAPATAATEKPEAAVEDPPPASASKKSESSKDAENTVQAGLSSAQAATQDWWNMLQKQFDTLAAATAATMQSGAADAAAQAANESGAAVKSATVPAARKSATAKKASTSTVRKRRSAAPKKTN